MKTSTPILIAVDQIKNLPPITESEVFDTLRLLIGSMDSWEENGDSWEVLKRLSHAALGYQRSKFLLWMLRLLNFELKTYIVERHLAYMLSCTFAPIQGPELLEASDLLLNLGGHEIINELQGTTDGYAVLHNIISYRFCGNSVSAVVARGPDLHRRGFDTFCTPFEESPTSLSMYCARAFSNWLRALANVDVNLESFTNQELELNPELHAGWEKETLLELFAHGNRPDLHHRRVWACSDCLEENFPVRVQPYWRHSLERIKGRMHPYDPVSPVSEVDEDENVDLGSLGEATCGSTGLTPALDTTENVTLLNIDEVPTELESEPESEPVSEADTSEHSATTPIASVCLYGKLEMVCINCWLHHKRTGTRKQPAADEDLSKNEDTPTRDDSSDCDYSPS